jgi:NAD(P)-dependent dehydrogenase (short-subunit alcohol dehydrogenase family)
MVSVVIAGQGATATALADWYRQSGATVSQVSFDAELPAQVATITGPVDLLVVADDFEPARGSVTTLTRAALGPVLHRLTYQPFRLAALLKPQLADAQGRAVLLSRADARMDVPDPDGRYLERPFRAAAHQLWRCLSVEWHEAGISVGLVALDSSGMHPVERLVDAIGGMNVEPFPVELTDLEGHVLGW